MWGVAKRLLGRKASLAPIATRRVRVRFRLTHPDTDRSHPMMDRPMTAAEADRLVDQQMEAEALHEITWHGNHIGWAETAEEALAERARIEAR